MSTMNHKICCILAKSVQKPQSLTYGVFAGSNVLKGLECVSKIDWKNTENSCNLVFSICIKYRYQKKSVRVYTGYRKQIQNTQLWYLSTFQMYLSTVLK